MSTISNRPTHTSILFSYFLFVHIEEGMKVKMTILDILLDRYAELYRFIFILKTRNQNVEKQI